MRRTRRGRTTSRRRLLLLSKLLSLPVQVILSLPGPVILLLPELLSLPVGVILPPPGLLSLPVRVILSLPGWVILLLPALLSSAARLILLLPELLSGSRKFWTFTHATQRTKRRHRGLSLGSSQDGEGSNFQRDYAAGNHSRSVEHAGPSGTGELILHFITIWAALIASPAPNNFTQDIIISWNQCSEIPGLMP
jgi:hypothetical protein